MKILQIFGVVAAVHAGLFLVLFAVPGCRSSGKPSAAAKPAVVETVPVYASESITPSLVQSHSSLDDSSLNPAFAPASAPVAPSSSGRYAPTRPSSSVTTTPASTSVAVTTTPEIEPVSTYTVVKGDSLWGIAKKNGITVAELAAANNLSAKAGVRIGQKLIVPGSVAGESVAAVPAEAKAAPAGVSYTVMPGDTLSGIAKKSGTTVNALRTANRLSGDMLRAGQTLIVPTAIKPASTNASPAAASTSSGSFTHLVKPGDTLGAIALKYNVSVGELATVNNITDPTRLRAGQELKVPGWQAPPAVTTGKVNVEPAPAPVPSTYVPESVAPPVAPSLVPTPVEPSTDYTVPTEPELVPLVPVEDTGAPRVY